MNETFIYLSISQIAVLCLLRYVAKHWLFNSDKKLQDTLEAARTNPIALAHQFKKEIEEGQSLADITIRENERFIRRNNFEKFVFAGGHIAFVGLIVLGFIFMEYPWLFLCGSIILFWILVLGVKSENKS